MTGERMPISNVRARIAVVGSSPSSDAPGNRTHLPISRITVSGLICVIDPG